MAILKQTQWWMRAGGNEVNGGGYDGSNYPGGTNYADQDSYQLAVTDLTSTASTTATSAIGGFTAAMVGNCLRLASGAGTTAGYYFITAYTDTNTITLDRASGTYTAGVGKIGGAHASFQQYATGGLAAQPSVASPLAAGHRVNIRGAGTDNPSTADFDFTSLGANYWSYPNGDGTTGGQIQFKSYNGRAYIKCPSLLIYNSSYHSWEGFKFTKGGTSYGGIPIVNAQTCINCYFDMAGLDTTIMTAATVMNCWFYNTGSTAFGISPALTLGAYGSCALNCFFQDIRGYAIQVMNMALVSHTIITNCKGSGSGALFVQESGTSYQLTIANCTIDGNAGHGIMVASSGYSLHACRIFNNSISNNGAYGLSYPAGTEFNDQHTPYCNYNNYFNNTGGARQNKTAGANDTALDPQYTNTASFNYSVGSNLKGIGFPGLITKTGTTSYVDIGAAQRQEVAGGSTIYVNRQDINMIPPWSIGM